MSNCLLSMIMGVALCAGAALADEVLVREAPPRPRVEHRSERPSDRHVWVAGYHRWDGHAYVWEPGRWEVPPREHAVWAAPRWEHRQDGYVFIEGYWK